jgi:hypothetical protein
MKMTAEQQIQFEGWLRAKCSNLKCALCQGVRWKIGELPMTPHVNPAGKTGSEEPAIVHLVCKNCAHVVLFDLRRINADEGPDPSKTMIF